MRPIIAILVLVAPGSAIAAPFQPGNLLIVNKSIRTLTEYTTEGSLIQSINIPSSGLGFSDIGDVVVDQFGMAHIAHVAYGGGSGGHLSTYDPWNEFWVHRRVPTNSGGSRNRGSRLSLQDGKILGMGAVFDIESQTFSVFRDWSQGYTSAIWGPDGVAYAVNSGSPQYEILRKLPRNFGSLPSVYVKGLSDYLHINALALLENGDVLAGAESGQLYIYRADLGRAPDPWGWPSTPQNALAPLRALDAAADGVIDVEVGSDGVIAASTSRGQLILSDEYFSSHKVLLVGRANVSDGSSMDELYITFVPRYAIPEPCTLVILLTGAVLYFDGRRSHQYDGVYENSPARLRPGFATGPGLESSS